jgi:hypothetical protein
MPADTRVGDRTRTGDMLIHSQGSDTTSPEPDPASDKGLRTNQSPPMDRLAPGLRIFPTGQVQPPPADPDLARVITAWPSLPEPIRRAVLLMIQSADPRT